MNTIRIDVEALQHNLKKIDDLISGHGGTWTAVTKVLCGHEPTIQTLLRLGVTSIGDSRLENFKDIKLLLPEVESWYLRVPGMSTIGDVITYSDISLNSETKIIEALDAEAGRQGKIHRIIIMIELGDLREGILPGALVTFYKHVFEKPNIEVIGIGANLGCLVGVIPSVDQFMQLALYRELLELKFHKSLPFISAGSSSSLPLLQENAMPKPINHFRIGEALFLGSDLINGGTLPGFRDDVCILSSEICEIKEKNLTASGEISPNTPFSNLASPEYSPGQRGYRALVSIGNLDTDVAGLTPLNTDYIIAGASSDITVVNVGESQNGLKVGDKIDFRLNYGGLLRLMSVKYIDRILTNDCTLAEHPTPQRTQACRPVHPLVTASD